MAAKGRVTKGVVWSAAERFSAQAVQFVVSMVLARLLTPEIFGMVALSLVILNILQTINELGFGAALMQKLDRDELDFSTVFVLNMFLGLTLYAILFFTAPIIARLSGYCEITPVIRWIGLNLIITSFVVVQRTKLFIAVNFKTLAKASFIAVLISGSVGIWCAYSGMGVMTLVIQSLLNNAITTLLIWIYIPWRPKLVFSRHRFFRLFNYAYKLILSRLVQSVYNEVYALVVGIFYTPAQLGLYNRAKNIESISSNNITQIVQRVSTPVLCETQNDHGEMSKVLLKFINSTALIVYPLLIGLMVLARPLIVVLLTEKWEGSIWILQVVSLLGFSFVLSTFNLTVFNATGRTDLALKSELIRKTIAIIVIIAAVYHSFETLVWSQVLISLIELTINLYFTKKQIGLSIMKQLLSVFPILLSSAIMGIVVHLVSGLFDSYYWQLVVGTLAGVVTYGVICYVFNVRDSRNLVKLFLP